ncbi:hypothetical protein MIN45_P0475 [Methylomarinovum tepidoasis]|uniref:Uncharacterized protein n=1 Tax=Methylomarinovum tepidoasis TaxID=2840183 RepID=A0AAU9BXC0_9GAMM|nr:hypothetical protein [Methylomarinovum sp. IN45]BCX88108.1 hypothetical protein MIN45_P0475 [Methylomarinovum sp. IN45]
MTKTITALTAAIVGLTLASGAMAAGSKIKNSTITNKSTVKNAANLAISTGIGKAEANQGSIKIKGSTVKNSTITNKSTVKNAANLAISTGLGSTKANQGSIDIE